MRFLDNLFKKSDQKQTAITPQITSQQKLKISLAENDIEKLKEAFEQGAKIFNHQGGEFKHTLHEAIFFRCGVDVFRELFRNGAKCLNEENEYFYNTIPYLVDREESTRRKTSNDVVECLLMNGADYQMLRDIDQHSKSRKEEIAALFETVSFGVTANSRSEKSAPERAALNDTAILKEVADFMSKENPDKFIDYAIKNRQEANRDFKLAILKGDLNLLRKAYKAGADVDFTVSKSGEKTSTVLEMALDQLEKERDKNMINVRTEISEFIINRISVDDTKWLESMQSRIDNVNTVSHIKAYEASKLQGKMDQKTI